MELVVAIIGEHHFQNQLLQNFIEQRLKINCVITDNLLTLASSSDQPPSRRLILWDCLNLPPVDLWIQFEAGFPQKEANKEVVLFNLEPVKLLAAEALAQGIKGIFHPKDSLDTFEKGIQAIINNELWFSREVLSKSVQESRQLLRNNTTHPASILTQREKQILRMIAEGAPNSIISETLHISPHTVRTHINNIYGKIKAPSRVQAVLWTVKNL